MVLLNGHAYFAGNSIMSVFCSFSPWQINGMMSYNFWQDFDQSYASVFPYSPSIMLHAFDYLLCFKLCQHNQPGPIHKEFNGMKTTMCTI